MTVHSLYICNQVYCTHVQGHDPLILSFRSFFLFDWVGVLWPQLSKVLKPVRWAGSVPFSQVSLQRQAVCLLLRSVFMCSLGESLHCFLVGWCTNKSYVIATSDLWLFIHASNLLPSTPHPTPLHIVWTRLRLVIHDKYPDNLQRELSR